MAKMVRRTLLVRLLIGGLLLAGLLALIHSCTESRAQGDSQSGTEPAAPSAPAGPEPAAPPAGTPAATDAAASGGAVQGPEGAVPANPSGPGPVADGHDSGQSAVPSATPQPAGTAPNPPASSTEGQQPTGFTALEKDWPAGGSADEAAGEAPEQQAPSMELTDEARDFAGRWVAAVINKDGQARLLASEDEWAFNLGRDGRCLTRQKLDGKYWEQNGWWQMQGDTVTLSLGPGGVWVFGTQRQDSDISVWTRAAENEQGAKFTLFCVRTPETKMPPGLASNYTSDFGPLHFQPSGPGHWRAAYGDPVGKLNLTRVGGFLAGRWEQEPGVGYVLFKLNSEGNRGAAASLDGVWWYAGSGGFDGQWRADRTK